MKLSRQKIILAFCIVFPFGIASLYNACARIGTSYVSTAPSLMALSSLNSGCSSSLLSTYSQTFHPFLVNYCNSCHANAHGSTDVNISFQAFMSKGETLIIYQATHAHGGNSFGPQMQTPINVFYPTWKAGMDTYNACLLRQSNAAAASSIVSRSMPTIGKTVPTINMNTYVDLIFDLEKDFLDQTVKIPVTLKIKVKYLSYLGAVTGFTFKDPTIQLKSGTMTYQIGDLHFLLDDQPQDFVTTYSDTLATVNSTTAVPVAPNYGAAVAYYELASTTTKIAIDVRKIGGAAISSAPVTPVTPVTPAPTVVTFTQLISTDATLGVFQSKCVVCHSVSNASAGLDLTNYTAAKAKAPTILSRVQNAGSPMPPTGLLPAASIDIVGKWVNGGAPQ